MIKKIWYGKLGRKIDCFFNNKKKKFRKSLAEDTDIQSMEYIYMNGHFIRLDIRDTLLFADNMLLLLPGGFFIKLFSMIAGSGIEAVELLPTTKTLKIVKAPTSIS